MTFLYPWGNTQQLNLEWILQKIKNLETNNASNLEDVAHALISASYRTQAYDRSDIVFHDGKLYRANQAIPAPGEAWTPAHWDEILLGDTVSNLVQYVAALSNDQIVNNSNVPGMHTSDALNTLNSAVNNLNSAIKVNVDNDFIQIPFTIDGSGYIDSSSGNSVSSSLQSHTDYIDISSYATIKYKQTAFTGSTSSGIAFYDDHKNYLFGIGGLRSQPQQKYADKLNEINTPTNAKYIRCSTFTNTNNYGNFEIYGEIIPYDRRFVNDLNLHIYPKNISILNAIRRIRQMTDIKWTPIANLPRAFTYTGEKYNSNSAEAFPGIFKADQEYTGLPYSNVSGRFIGTEVSIESFASSVQRSDTKLFTQSAYSDESPDYMGVVCTSVVCYALNIPKVTVAYWSNIDGMTAAGTVNGTVAGNFRLCDIFVNASHAAMITDIINGGEYIEISEATRQGNTKPADTSYVEGGKCRRKIYSYTELKKYFEGFTIYRYSYLDNIPYRINDIIPLMPDKDIIHYPYLPVIPENGNKCGIANSTPRNIRLLFDANDYETLVVLKDGEKWNQDGTTNPYNVSGLTSLQITCDAGFSEYEAYLTKTINSHTIQTVSCKWCVRCSVYPTRNINGDTITFNLRIKGTKFKPWFVTFGTSSADTNDRTKQGRFLIIRDYTVDDNGDGSYTYHCTVPYPTTDNTYKRFGITSLEYGSASGAEAI